MRTLLVLAIAALLFGCERREPAFSDAEFAPISASNPGMTQACLDKVRYGGIEAWEPDNPDCYQMLPAQRWAGLWEHGWEWTNFCPDPAKRCEWMARRGIWLVFSEKAGADRDLPDGVHRIEFVGRRTKIAADYGHTGSYEHMMVVDRVISIKTIKGEKYKKRF